MAARGLVIAGTASGVGKTTITAALIGALTARGHHVQPFKAGPDYIDPSYHARAAGRPCRNLDSWLLPAPALRELFTRATAGADFAIVEGVMGLFDGRTGEDEAGSTAHLAKLLGLPVLLVVDAGKVARTAAALVLGCQQFDPAVRLVGVILNNIGSDGHYALCRDAIEQATGVPVLGRLPRRPDLSLPERHLGLIPAAEGRVADDWFAATSALAAAHFDTDRLLALATPITPAPPAGLFPDRPVAPRIRLAVARDQAFNFYYQDSLDLLAAWGAELAPFSPLNDADLPVGADGVYLGGGFPELFAGELAANLPLRAALRMAAAHRRPIYGECGGLMYLGATMEDFDGVTHPMAGVVPLRSRLRQRRLTLGYRVATARRATALLRAGERVRGHEFHWSELVEPVSEADAAYDLEGVGRVEGYAAGSVLAAYTHLHFGADARLAPRFVAACAAAAGREAAP